MNPENLQSSEIAGFFPSFGGGGGRLVIFDLDGTLLDTIEDLANSTNFALQKHGFSTHSVDDYRFFVGNGITRLIERALPEEARDETTVALLMQDFMIYYLAHAEEYTHPYPGIEKLLADIHRAGIKIAVASNKVQAATGQLIENYFPDIPFAAVYGQREDMPIKPHPAVVNEIVKETGVTKSEVLYVGDSGVDVQTAVNAQVDLMAVLWGFRPKSELLEAGATRFAEKPDDIFQYLLQLTHF